MSNLPELEPLRIPFDDIKIATNNFARQNFLGQGGFGPVYKGQLPSSTLLSEPGTEVAVKRLDVKRGQGQQQFLMEIVTLASYKHQNLVSLVGFSEEGNEKVLVYKHEVKGSLDKHLSSTNLSWEQRLQICVGAAQGLEYLHGVRPGHRVLHRDVKSSNILLDAKFEAKISDFGLSTIGPANQQFTFIVTNACGTFGYLDPQYVKTGILTKESDVYSFGIVLFEVLCGRLAMVVEDDESTFLSHLVKTHKKKGTLHEIIMPYLLQENNQYTLETFINIALQCLDEDRKQRPTMSSVVEGLETVLKHQLDTSGFSGTKQSPWMSLVGKGVETASKHPHRTQTELWGSATGGRPFSFRLKSNQKLKKIKILHEGLIQSLIFTAEDSNGRLHSSRLFGGRHDRHETSVVINSFPYAYT
ncbi:putative receptor-like protein kinase At2g23200 [Bidens hawaiensis]|uniref:putative receptor-like protein kinase At2g23200 n=1 Tax=Bidens hawaiensis TaxID=980011 RepID=UPI00404AEC46